MIGVRHFLHPVQSARILCRRINAFIYRAFHSKEPKTIRREENDACWCGGSLTPYRWHASYGICTNCGTYVNRRPPADEELCRIYSFDYYWHERQKLRGNPVIERRAANDRSDGRLDYWLKIIKRYHPANGQVIEIG